MRTAARLALAFVLLFGGLLALPRSAGRVFTSDAQAQIVPTPTIPPILSTPEPSPTIPDGDDGGDGGSDDGSGDAGSGSDSGGSGGDSSSDDANKPSKDEQGDSTKKGNKGSKGNGGRGGRPGGNTFVGDYQPTGTFSTDKLVAVAARLRSLGVSKDEIVAKVFPPFIIGGESAWSNTWGAPRYGPGPIVRTHEGQDVFCKYGDPVLAPTAGTVNYSDGGLGGITARVFMSSNNYWYLTHLSDINDEEHPLGSHVEAGDVVGFCGNSGNAASTPTHVHFGHYVNGDAVNPMRYLVRWLHTAERRVLGVVSKTAQKRVKQADRLTLARRFGDSFAPDLSELDVNGESLLASGSSPATGAFALAEAALQQALAESLPALTGDQIVADSGSDLLTSSDQGDSAVATGATTNSSGLSRAFGGGLSPESGD